MDGTPETPAPGDPLAVSDSHVEALLQEAESLVGEIAETAGVEAKRRKTVNAAGEFGAIEPDPAAAVELTVIDAAQVSAALETVESAEESSSPERLTPEPQEFVPEAAQGLQAEAAATEAQSETGPSPENQSGDVESAQSGEAAHSIKAEDPADSPALEAAEAGMIQPTAPATESQPGFPRRLLSVIRQAPKASARFVLTSVSRVLGEVVILLDRPFAHLPSETKQRIGLIGLGTLLMGASGFLLPRLMEHNPYLELDPPPAANSESGGSEHVGKEKPAKADSKHADSGKPAGKSSHTAGSGHGAKSH